MYFVTLPTITSKNNETILALHVFFIFRRLYTRTFWIFMTYPPLSPIHNVEDILLSKKCGLVSLQQHCFRGEGGSKHKVSNIFAPDCKYKKSVTKVMKQFFNYLWRSTISVFTCLRRYCMRLFCTKKFSYPQSDVWSEQTSENVFASARLYGSWRAVWAVIFLKFIILILSFYSIGKISVKTYLIWARLVIGFPRQ